MDRKLAVLPIAAPPALCYNPSVKNQIGLTFLLRRAIGIALLIRVVSSEAYPEEDSLARS